MSSRNRMLNMMADVMRVPEQAVTYYQRSEYEYSGPSLAWESAAGEWMNYHFSSWKSAQWQQAVSAAMAVA